MEYEILNEDSLANVKAAYEERCGDWTIEQFSTFVNNYSVELNKLIASVKFKALGIELYSKDSTIQTPVFAYETVQEYSDLLRDMKIPEMKAGLQEERAKLEATHYQIELAKHDIEHFDERVVKVVNAEVVEEEEAK